MPQRKCTKDLPEVTRPHKRITLPIEMERYNEIVGDCQAYRKWLDGMMSKHPELFPENRLSENFRDTDFSYTDPYTARKGR